MTTDSFVVKPLRFPGGSIGELAVNGTVNDLAMAGAMPLALTLSLVLEEGLPAQELRTEIEAIAGAAREAHVEIVAGDTKVVERGHADGMYICTTGLGRRDPRARLAPNLLEPGDRILVSRLDRRARHRDHARPRGAWPRRRHPIRHPLAVAGRRRTARRRRRRASTACATPPAEASPQYSTSSRVPPAWRSSCARPLCPCRTPWPAPPSCSGIDPMYVANEGKLVAFVRPERAPACARCVARAARRARTRRRSARSRPSHPGWCLSRLRLAGGA